ncbi:MAG: CoA transferase [Dehalococcoidia bacterium]|nr:CoA transferase [Dehalococcoidia bacterium]
MAGEKAALAPYRVLDLSDENGQMCGKILAELGADVIKVEPPGGDQSRSIGPFYHDEPDPEKSLFWYALNRSKRGITLNIESAVGREILLRLVRIADFVVETVEPGYLDSLGLGYEKLGETNPRIILTSITPFGQNGPRKDYKASDIVSMAMGGLMGLCGDEEHPPLRFGVPQAMYLAGSQAAAGTMIAHYFRQLTGEGQQVDVSIQESVVLATYHTQQFWNMHRVLRPRHGKGWDQGPPIGYTELQFPCKDGYIAGSIGGPSAVPLLKWLAQEGLDEGIDDSLKQRDWTKLDSFYIKPEERREIEKAVKRLAMRHTGDELYEEALARRILWFKVNTPKGIVESPQLKARDFFQRLDHPELADTITYPGAPVWLSETPWQIKSRAPMIGEHNLAVLHEELGMSRQELAVLKAEGVI